MSNVGNLMHLWMHKVRSGLPTAAPSFLVQGAADILTRSGGSNWLPVVVREIQDPEYDYEVIGNSFVYSAAAEAGLDRIWCVVAEDSELAIEVARVLSQEIAPRINLSSASYDQIVEALEYVVSQPDTPLKTLKVQLAAPRISEASRETWSDLEPITKLKCGITKGPKLDYLERVFYITPPPLPPIPELSILKSLKVKELKDLVRLHGLASKPNPKKNDLVTLLDQARSS